MRDLPVRKKMRLDGYDYSRKGCYFVTICVKEKYELLGQIVGDAVPSVPLTTSLSEIGNIISDYLIKMNDALSNATLDNFVIMPNHIHLLISLRDIEKKQGVSDNDGTQRTASPTHSVIPRIVHGMKSVTTKRIGYSIWQKSYHDHIIRSKTEYEKISQYINENPAKWREDRYFTDAKPQEVMKS